MQPRAKVDGLIPGSAGGVEILLLELGISEQYDVEGAPANIAVHHVEGSASEVFCFVSLAQFAEAVAELCSHISFVEVTKPLGRVGSARAFERLLGRVERPAASGGLVTKGKRVSLHDQRL